jgi:hypothetical protein
MTPPFFLELGHEESKKRRQDRRLDGSSIAVNVRPRLLFSAISFPALVLEWHLPLLFHDLIWLLRTLDRCSGSCSRGLGESLLHLEQPGTARRLVSCRQ